VIDVFVAIDAIARQGFPIDTICSALHVSRSGYYDYLQQRLGKRQIADSELRPLIVEIFWDHRRRYGARRIRQELIGRGYRCDVRRVARLMKEAGLRAIQPRSFRPRTTHSRHDFGYSPNLLLFSPLPQAINQVWVADITYIPLKTSVFLYLAMLMDRFSRRIVGWHLDDHMTERLTLAALQGAIAQRQPSRGLIHHSDRGSQYAAGDYRRMLQRAGMQSSMSRKANTYDNAFMESCFGTIKTELEMQSYEDMPDARRQIAEYVTYYDVQRRHSGIGYYSPLQYEETVVRGFGSIKEPSASPAGSESSGHAIQDC